MNLTKGTYYLQPLPSRPLSLKKQQNSILQQSNLLSTQIIRQAQQKSHRLANKIKQLRTLLGYDHNDQKDQRKSTEKKKSSGQEKAVNLKKLVLSMRKKTDKNFDNIDQSIINPLMSGQEERQKSCMFQYTQATLRYIHSFLPHQTLMENQIKKRKMTIDSQNKSPHLTLDVSDLSRPTYSERDTHLLFSSPKDKKLSLSHPKNNNNGLFDIVATEEAFRDKQKRQIIYLPSYYHQTKSNKLKEVDSSKGLLRSGFEESFRKRGPEIQYRAKRHRIDIRSCSQNQTDHKISTQKDTYSNPNIAKALLPSQILVKRLA